VDWWGRKTVRGQWESSPLSTRVFVGLRAACALLLLSPDASAYCELPANSNNMTRAGDHTEQNISWTAGLIPSGFES
jgi:hypothetical protein